LSAAFCSVLVSGAVTAASTPHCQGASSVAAASLATTRSRQAGSVGMLPSGPSMASATISVPARRSAASPPAVPKLMTPDAPRASAAASARSSKSLRAA